MPTTPSAPVVVSSTPAVSATQKYIAMGVNGHDGKAPYPMETIESRFKVLDANNLRSYRTSGEMLNDQRYSEMDTLLALAKKYNINIRPMVYPTTQARAYEYGKRYGASMKIWEIGNELDLTEGDDAQDYAAMVATYKGLKQASDEFGYNLKYTINATACNDDAPGRCYGKKDGSIYFLDGAKAAGFNFDYISFHYYSFYGDKGYWYDKFYGQMRGMATKYKTKIFYNEMNCAEIYGANGNKDGGFAGDKACYDSLKQMITTINTSYKDIVQEMNIYELLDEPGHEIEWEKHFGLMYDINNPKPLFNMVTSFTK
ncbi:hypothetical protein CIK05_02490 [Bdellovibrio sp. qaytius]|nr:hypothetical protein CIK05_02490 [Bdellovibrio sp. qaytius]